jgi:phosphatidate cytidylyltransferase
MPAGDEWGLMAWGLDDADGETGEVPDTLAARGESDAEVDAAPDLVVASPEEESVDAVASPEPEKAEIPAEALVEETDAEADAEVDAEVDEDDWDAFADEGYLQATTREHAGLAEAIARAADEEAEQMALSAEIPGLDSSLVGFEDVITEDRIDDDEEPEIAPTRSDLPLRVVTGLVLLGAFLGAVWWGETGIGALVVAVMIIALGEFYFVMGRRGYRPMALIGFVGGAGVLVGAHLWGLQAIPAGVILTTVALLVFYAVAPGRTHPLTNAGVTLLGVAWIPGLGAFAMGLLDAEHFRWLVFGTVAITMLMDTAQYFAGRNWGSHALAPVLSPNKTVEGLIGGIVTAVLLGVALGYIGPFDDLWPGVLLGITVAVAAPLGDLAVSMVKRSLGVKDMGSILPGHGGWFDRIDALLFVLPVAWLVYNWGGFLG